MAQFPNYYAYGELGNALKVAQESFVGRLVAASGPTINNASLAPPGTQLDPKQLPAPLGWLLPPLP